MLGGTWLQQAETSSPMEQIDLASRVLHSWVKRQTFITCEHAGTSRAPGGSYQRILLGFKKARTSISMATMIPSTHPIQPVCANTFTTRMSAAELLNTSGLALA